VREVVQEVLVEWNIPLAKVFAILTDNGSNMLKAFHSSFVESEDDQDDQDDKGSGDREEKDVYEKEQGDVEEDKDVEESAMQEISVDQEKEEECDRMERNHEVAFDGLHVLLSGLVALHIPFNW